MIANGSDEDHRYSITKKYENFSRCDLEVDTISCSIGSLADDAFVRKEQIEWCRNEHPRAFRLMRGLTQVESAKKDDEIGRQANHTVGALSSRNGAMRMANGRKRRPNGSTTDRQVLCFELF
jgi:hypothetical protein